MSNPQVEKKMTLPMCCGQILYAAKGVHSSTNLLISEIKAHYLTSFHSLKSSSPKRTRALYLCILCNNIECSTLLGNYSYSKNNDHCDSRVYSSLVP